jgi:hypothetical protein
MTKHGPSVNDELDAIAISNRNVDDWPTALRCLTVLVAGCQASLSCTNL